jgi:hypothetical protein
MTKAWTARLMILTLVELLFAAGCTKAASAENAVYIYASDETRAESITAFTTEPACHGVTVVSTLTGNAGTQSDCTTTRPCSRAILQHKGGRRTVIERGEKNPQLRNRATSLSTSAVRKPPTVEREQSKPSRRSWQPERKVYNPVAWKVTSRIGSG